MATNAPTPNFSVTGFEQSPPEQDQATVANTSASVEPTGATPDISKNIAESIKSMKTVGEYEPSPAVHANLHYDPKSHKYVDLGVPNVSSIGIPHDADANAVSDAVYSAYNKIFPFRSAEDKDLLTDVGKVVGATEAMSRKGAEVGGKVALGMLTGQGTVTGFEPVEDLPTVTPEEFKKSNPVAAGIAQGLGETVGGFVADPKNWPLMFSASAAPLLRSSIQFGFAMLMGKGMVDEANQLAENWDNLTPDERAKEVTKLGLGTIMAVEATRHATNNGVDAITGTKIGEASHVAVEINGKNYDLPKEHAGWMAEAIHKYTAENEPLFHGPYPEAEVKQPIAEGLTPEGANFSNEEIARQARGEKYYTVSKGGNITAQMSQPDAASDLKGGAVVKVLPDGTYDVQRGDSSIAEKYKDRVLEANKPPKDLSVADDWQKIVESTEPGTEHVQTAFPNSDVSRLTDSSWKVKTPAGHDIIVVKTPEVSTEGSGITLKNNQYAAGSWQQIDTGGIMYLAKIAGQDTVHHEAFHAAMDLALSKAERKSIIDRYGNEEMAAEAYGKWKPQAETNTLFGKIQAYFGRLYNSILNPAENVFSDIRSGKAWEKSAKQAGLDNTVNLSIGKKPVSDDNLTKKIMAEHALGGSTFNAKTGENQKDSNTYAVSTEPDRTRVINGPITDKHIADFRKDNADKLIKDSDNYSLGTWKAGDGSHQLDVVRHVKTEAEAQKLGRENRQIAAYHLGDKGEVPIQYPLTNALREKYGTDNNPAQTGFVSVNGDFISLGPTEHPPALMAAFRDAGIKLPKDITINNVLPWFLDQEGAVRVRIRRSPAGWEMAISSPTNIRPETVDTLKRGLESMGPHANAYVEKTTPDESSNQYKRIEEANPDKLETALRDIKAYTAKAPEVVPEIKNPLAAAAESLGGKEANDPIDLLRPEEKARLTPKAQAKLRDEYARLQGSIPEQAAAVRVGMTASDWWDRGHKVYHAMSDADPASFPPELQTQFANVVGSTSPHQSVEMATLEALHVWNQWMEKIYEPSKPNTEANIRKYVKFFSLEAAKMPNLVRALRGEDLFAGRTKSFKAPTMGQALQAPTTITRESGVMDSHMGDIHGINQEAMAKPQTYYAMVANSRAVANEVSRQIGERIDTRDVQAAQWATKLAIKNLLQETPTAPAGKILERLTPEVIDSYKKDIVDILGSNDIIRFQGKDYRIPEMLKELYGEEFVTKLNEGLAKIPKTTRKGSPASGYIPELTPLVERLRTKYGKPVEPEIEPEQAIEEGDTSFDFGANVIKAAKKPLGGQ